MPTEHILALLIAERDKLNRALEALQGPIKRRGRPPKNAIGSMPSTSTAPAKKRAFTAATRRKMAAAQRKRWANRSKD